MEQLLNLSNTLSPPQRLLSCCFDCKGILAVRLGRGKSGSARGMMGRGKREERPFPLPIVPRAPSQTQCYYKFPIGSLCGGESQIPELGRLATILIVYEEPLLNVLPRMTASGKSCEVRFLSGHTKKGNEDPLSTADQL